MKKLVMMAVVAASLVLSMVASAAPPGKPGRGGMGRGWADDSAESQERQDAHRKRGRMAFVVAVAEALELNEAEALKLSEKVKSADEKRHPIRQQMFGAMKEVRAAAAGNEAALAQVDANIQKVLDGRAQMAALDMELYALLAKDLDPQRRAKLALAMAKMHGVGRGGGMDRRSR